MTQTKAELLQTRHQGDIRLGDADSSHYVGFKAPATVSSSLVWTLPAADGSANQFLKTNASGVLSWGTVDTSTLMPLGGGTFTGDVSFASNSISNAVNWSKAANIFQVRDATKLTFGNSNDLEIFHDGNNSYIDDISGTGALKIRTNQLLLQNNSGDENYLIANSNGQVELYHNNVKKIETSAAGISITGALTVSTDATITGNLTVSGTTTTINTQTLDVEDKNVVIGKVSSPSDTTADGGGWTLKGATDKTFNWVNATDAWTSSEHIHLGDNKKFLAGTGSDLQLSHDGTDSYLDHRLGSGLLRINATTGAEIHITTDGPETLAKFIPNGAVELYYDNSKKLETTTNGVRIEGLDTVTSVGSPAALQLEGGDADGEFVNLRFTTQASGPLANISGKAVTTGTYPNSVGELIFSVQNANASYEALKITSNRDINIPTDGKKLQLGASQDLQIYHSGSASWIYDNGTGPLYIGTNNSNIEINGGGSANDTMAKFKSTEGVELYFNGSKKFETTTGGINVTGAINVNGSALSTAPTVTGTASGTLTANRGVIVQSDGTFKQPSILADNVSSEVVANGNNSSRTTKVIYIEDSKYLVGYQQGSNGKLCLKIATVSGSTVSYGSEVTVGDLSGGNFWDAAWSGTHLLIARTGNSSGHMYRRNATISGTTISLGGDNLVNNGGAMGEIQVNYNKAKSKFLICYRRDQTGQYVLRGCDSDGSSNFYGPQLIQGSVNTNFQCYTIRYHEYKQTHVITYTEQNSTKRQYIGVFYLDSSNNTQVSSFSNLGNDSLNQSQGGRTGLAFKPNSDRIVCFFPLSPSSTQVLKAEVFDITQSTITGVSGGLTLLQAGNSSTASRYSSVTADYDSTKDRYIVCYRKGVTSGRPYITSATMAANGGSFSSLTTTEVDTDTLNDNEAPNVFYRHTSATGKGLVTYIPSSQSYVQSRVFSLSASDLEADRFIGFASAGYSNGQTATINVVGNTTTQSSLTPGAKYYVQGDGTVATSAIAPSVIAGTAISSTKILIKPA